MSATAEGVHSEAVNGAAMIPQLHAHQDLTDTQGPYPNHVSTSADALEAPPNPWAANIAQPGVFRGHAALQPPGLNVASSQYQHYTAAASGATPNQPFDSPAVTSASEPPEVSPSPDLMHQTGSPAVWKAAVDTGGGFDYGIVGDGEGGGGLPADMPPVGPECNLPASLTEAWGLTATRVFTTTKPPKLYQTKSLAIGFTHMKELGLIANTSTRAGRPECIPVPLLRVVVDGVVVHEQVSQSGAEGPRIQIPPTGTSYFLRGATGGLLTSLSSCALLPLRAVVSSSTATNTLGSTAIPSSVWAPAVAPSGGMLCMLVMYAKSGGSATAPPVPPSATASAAQPPLPALPVVPHQSVSQGVCPSSSAAVTGAATSHHAATSAMLDPSPASYVTPILPVPSTAVGSTPAVPSYASGLYREKVTGASSTPVVAESAVVRAAKAAAAAAAGAAAAGSGVNSVSVVTQVPTSSVAAAVSQLVQAVGTSSGAGLAFVEPPVQLEGSGGGAGTPVWVGTQVVTSVDQLRGLGVLPEPLPQHLSSLPVGVEVNGTKLPDVLTKVLSFSGPPSRLCLVGGAKGLLRLLAGAELLPWGVSQAPGGGPGQKPQPQVVLRVNMPPPPRPGLKGFLDKEQYNYNAPLTAYGGFAGHVLRCGASILTSLGLIKPQSSHNPGVVAIMLGVMRDGVLIPVTQRAVFKQELSGQWTVGAWPSIGVLIKEADIVGWERWMPAPPKQPQQQVAHHHQPQQRADPHAADMQLDADQQQQQQQQLEGSAQREDQPMQPSTEAHHNQQNLQEQAPAQVLSLLQQDDCSSQLQQGGSAKAADQRHQQQEPQQGEAVVVEHKHSGEASFSVPAASVLGSGSEQQQPPHSLALAQSAPASAAVIPAISVGPAVAKPACAVVAVEEAGSLRPASRASFGGTAASWGSGDTDTTVTADEQACRDGLMALADAIAASDDAHTADPDTLSGAALLGRLHGGYHMEGVMTEECDQDNSNDIPLAPGMVIVKLISKGAGIGAAGTTAAPAPTSAAAPAPATSQQRPVPPANGAAANLATTLLARLHQQLLNQQIQNSKQDGVSGTSGGSQKGTGGTTGPSEAIQDVLAGAPAPAAPAGSVLHTVTTSAGIKRPAAVAGIDGAGSTPDLGYLGSPQQRIKLERASGTHAVGVAGSSGAVVTPGPLIAPGGQQPASSLLHQHQGPAVPQDAGAALQGHAPVGPTAGHPPLQLAHISGTQEEVLLQVQQQVHTAVASLASALVQAVASLVRSQPGSASGPAGAAGVSNGEAAGRQGVGVGTAIAAAAAGAGGEAGVQGTPGVPPVPADESGEGAVHLPELSLPEGTSDDPSSAQIPLHLRQQVTRALLTAIRAVGRGKPASWVAAVSLKLSQVPPAGLMQFMGCSYEVLRMALSMLPDEQMMATARKVLEDFLGLDGDAL